MNFCNNCYAEEGLLMKHDCSNSSYVLCERVLEEIRETIKDKHKYGVTQSTLADELGISREYFSRMLNNSCEMKLSLFIYLINRLELRECLLKL